MKKTIIFIFFLYINNFAQTESGKSVKELMLLAKYSQAVSLLEKKEAGGTDLTYEEKFNLAQAYQRLMNHDKALKILFHLSREKSGDAAVLFAMGESFRALGNKRAAAGVYKEVIEKDSTNIIARIELAKLFVELKNYNEANSIYKFLAQQESENPYYLRRYGYTLHKLGDNKEAEKFLRKALKINERDAKAALWLAKIFYDKESYEDAFEILKKSIVFNSFDLPLNKLAAEVLFKMKKYLSAANQYKNAIIIGDSSAAMYQKLGLSLYSSVASRDSIDAKEKEDKLFEAVDAFQISLEKEDSSNPLTLTYLGFCHKTLKNYDAAIDYLNKALDSMTPGYIDKVYKNLGASYELKNNFPDAIKAYNNSLKYSGGETLDIVFRLATLYDRFYADKSVALAHYKKYLKLSDNSESELIKYAEQRVGKLKEEIHFGK